MPNYLDPFPYAFLGSDPRGYTLFPLSAKTSPFYPISRTDGGSFSPGPNPIACYQAPVSGSTGQESQYPAPTPVGNNPFSHDQDQTDSINTIYTDNDAFLAKNDDNPTTVPLANPTDSDGQSLRKPSDSQQLQAEAWMHAIETAYPQFSHAKKWLLERMFRNRVALYSVYSRIGDRDLGGLPSPQQLLLGRFKCRLCLKPRYIQNISSWKAHVYQDLRPFVCTWESCEYRQFSFGSRGSWIQHENLHLQHKQWRCHLCDFSCYVKRYLHFHRLQCHGNAAHDKSINDCLETSNYDGEPCPFCGRQISSWEDRRDHWVEHFEDISFVRI